MADEFVKGWHLLDTLGEGRFGEVKLLMNKESKEMVAVKVIVVNNPEMEKQIRKEICIHRNLNHPNVIGYFGNRNDSNIEYLFLEYATGGELFDRIEPDTGMEKRQAFKFFNDLLNGVEYLHSKGIAHRDIKPENLLLDSNDVLKISDFGMSTLFRHNGKQRMLDQKCGSFPYMAPEVLEGVKHQAEPIDIWSCGIVLVTLLTGQLPWDQASKESEQFVQWTKGKQKLHLSPWSHVSNLALSILKCILEYNPSKRYTLKQIRLHRWFKNNLEAADNDEYRNSPAKRPCYGFLSQPNLSSKSSFDDDQDDFDRSNRMDCGDNSNCDHKMNNYSFSQPNNIDDMFLSTQTQRELSIDLENGVSSQGMMTQPGTKLYLRVVRRMTRFFTNTDFDRTVTVLQKTFNDLNYSYKKQGHCQFTITMNDKRRMPLIFKSSVNEMNPTQILVDFRLSKGDGIEFKRQFLTIKNLLKPIISANNSNLSNGLL